MIVLQIKAQSIRKTLGMKSAAGFLRNQGVPIDTALYWLCGPAAYHRFMDMLP